jgi:hypothetical protein
VTTVSRLTSCLLVGCLVGLAAAGAALPAEKPSPQELWELYPLDPTGTGEGQRPATTTQRPVTTTQPPATTTQPPATTTQATVPAQEGAKGGGSADEGGGGAPLLLGFLLGGLVAAILMLCVAALPERAIPRVGGTLVDRRLDIALAGAFTLLVVMFVFVATSV